VDALEQIARIAPEVSGGYRQILDVVQRDGALPAAVKALLVGVCAAARGYADRAAEWCGRARELGAGDREAGTAAVALLLARGEETCDRFIQAAGGVRPTGPTRPPWEGAPEAYFLDYLGVSSLPKRMAIMAERVPDVFAGYQRMHHGSLAADPSATKLAELVLVALNAAELEQRFVQIHALTARKAGASDQELVEAVVCAMAVVGVAAWAAGAEGLFPDG
jgi:alkylhydroperoxidase/carboxymuconolactone decarboxylase family protein YurZ